MRIAVTGALGHIGSRLIRTLPAAFPQVQIVMIDDLSTRRHASLFHLPPAGHYEFVEADIMTADLKALFAGADMVIHLAALTNPERSVAFADEVARVNFSGTERVARACLETGSRLFFPSSTSVYAPADGVGREDGSPDDLRPQTPYAEWKLRSEELLRSLAATDDLRFLVFRMGTVFGPSPGMGFHTVVNRFCWSVATTQPVKVWRTALDQVRPYLDLSDAIGALMFMMRRGQFDGRVYNVATVNATVSDVLAAIRRRVPEFEIELVDSPIMNRLSYRVEPARLTGLGFRFSGSLAHGVADTLEWLRALASRRVGTASS